MKTILLCFLLATVQFAVASWREDHHVEGLPVIDNTNIKSYAGVVPVRKDNATNTEVLPRSLFLLTFRAVCFTGSLKRCSLNTTLRLWFYGFKVDQVPQVE